MVATAVSTASADLYRLFYPTLCAACSRVLMRSETTLCLGCISRLPTTDFHLHSDNQMEKHFWGKVNFERAASFLYFHKSNAVQRLMHMLKYKSRLDIGLFFGQLYAQELKNHSPYNAADIVIPVPLHDAKKRKRGYNQSELIATGLAEGLNLPCRTDLLLRTVITETQTRKTRLERWQNVSTIFECPSPEALKGKRVLLVDDVVTTGSTLEACAVALQKATGDIKVNFLTAAVAMS